MAELLTAHVERDSDEVAIADGHGEVSWDRLNARVNQWIDVLRERGLAAGDRVSVISGNRREAFEAALACLHAGLVLVPVNWHLTPDEVGYILADSGSRALIVDADRAATAAEALTRTGADWALLAVIGDQPVAAFEALEPLLAAADPAEPAAQSSGSVLLYTSGTSGRPKGVVTTLFRVGAPLSAIAGLLAMLGQGFGVPDRGRNLLVGPWYHSGQMFFSLFPLLRGCPLRVEARFEPDEFLEILRRDAITHTHLVPIHFTRLLRRRVAQPDLPPPPSLTLVWHGASACPVEVKRAMIDWWGPVFLEYYAATEGGIATVIDSKTWLARPGSVGRAVPPTELVIAGADGEPLPPGRDGTVYLRRPPERGFAYHNAPEKTLAAYLDERTFTYGDVGHLDEDGYLYITGRITDMIITGGVNVYPAEIESVLLRHPSIRDAAVFGIPDEEYGERVVAAVVADPDAPDDLPALLDRHCRESLAGFKVPRAYRLMPDLPREPSGKLRKHLLAQLTAPAPVGSGAS